MKTQDWLKEKLKILPRSPGVYLFKDAQGRVLYIGKAVNLQNRVASYALHYRDLEARLQFMVETARDLDIVRTKSEVEALLMEARLIRDIQPKFNIELKDGKSFPLLAIHREDDFPRVALDREMNVLHQNRRGFQPATAEYYGPFVEAGGLRQALRALQGVFKFRTCDLEIDEKGWSKKGYRPCLLYYIQMCTAPCAGKISKEEYGRDIDRLRQFLNGHGERVMEDLMREMEKAARRLEFERAARCRNQLRALERLSQRGELSETSSPELLEPLNPQEALMDLQKMLSLSTMPKRVDGVDIAHIRGNEAVGSIVCFKDGIPYKPGYRRFKIKNSSTFNELEMMREVVIRRFSRVVEEHEEVPDLFLIDGGKTHLEAVCRVLQALPVKPVLVALAKYERDHLYVACPAPGGYPRPFSNAFRPAEPRTGFLLLQYVRDEAHRFAQRYHHLLRGKRNIQR